MAHMKLMEDGNAPEGGSPRESAEVGVGGAPEAAITHESPQGGVGPEGQAGALATILAGLEVAVPNVPIEDILILDFEATCDAGAEELLSRLEQSNQHEIIEFVSTARLLVSRALASQTQLTT